MLTYQSSLQNAPPMGGAIRTPSPNAAYGRNHSDVLAALTSKQAADLNLQQQRATTDYSLEQQRAQRELALQGLNQMAQAEQNSQNLATARLQNATGIANSLLRGLYG